MISLQQIDHIELYVRDLDAAAQWYTEALGLQVTYRGDPEPIFVEAGGTALALFKAAADAKPPIPGHKPSPVRWSRVAFRTDDKGFTTAQARLKQLDIPFHGPVDHGFAWSIYFDDQDGLPLEITWYV